MSHAKIARLALCAICCVLHKLWHSATKLLCKDKMVIVVLAASKGDWVNAQGISLEQLWVIVVICFYPQYQRQLVSIIVL